MLGSLYGIVEVSFESLLFSQGVHKFCYKSGRLIFKILCLSLIVNQLIIFQLSITF